MQDRTATLKRMEDPAAGKIPHRRLELLRLKTLEELRPILIETIVKYGDSLTIIPPEEYISFVLRTDGLFAAAPRFDVISARKSWITDYKAGRLTLDAFKQKIIQYSN
jgi:hypothetical protein